MIRKWGLAVLAIGVLANPTLGEISVEEALEGFGFDSSETETDTSPIITGNSDLSDLDAILDEFESIDELPAPTLQTPEDPFQDTPRTSLSGSVRQKFVVNFSHDAPSPGEYDHRGLSSMSIRLDLKLDNKIGDDFRLFLGGHLLLDPIEPKQFQPAQNAGVSSFSDFEAELDEAYLQGPLSDSIDLTFGRQIVVWGRSDQFRVTDILNPVDNRTPGLTDIKNLRLPVTMARLDLYSGPWTSSLILIPERRFDRTPELGSDYYFGPATLPSRDNPGGKFSKPDFAVSITGTFSGWDLSFYSARILNRSPYIEEGPDGPVRKHQRISMLGSAANFVVGSWLFKTEATIHKSLRFSNVPEKDFERLTALVGVEYSGIVDTTLALEVVSGHIKDFDNRLLEQPNAQKENETEMAFRVGRTFLNESLELSMAARAPTPIGNNGGLLRTQVSYDLNDSVEIYGGTLLYFVGSNPLYSKIADNDRLFLGLNYHF